MKPNFENSYADAATARCPPLLHSESRRLSSFFCPPKENFTTIASFNFTDVARLPAHYPGA